MNLLTRIAAALGVRVVPDRMQPYAIRNTDLITAQEHCALLASHLNECALIAQSVKHEDAAIWLDAREHVLAIAAKLPPTPPAERRVRCWP